MIVKLRKRKLANGKTSLYLAFWNPDYKYQVTRGKNKGQWKYGRWEYDFLKLYLGDNPALNKKTMEKAKLIKDDRQVEFQNRQHGFQSQNEKKGNFVNYFQDIGGEKFSGNTRWTCILKYLSEFTRGYIAIKDINQEWLENFKTYLLSKVSQNTAVTYFFYLKWGLRKAVNDGIIEKDPGKNVKPIKQVEVKKVYLTLDEIKRLLNTPCRNENLKWSFLFGCFTGLRVSDLRRLTWMDIQKDDKGYKVEFRQQKTEGFEYLPLCETAVNFLNVKEGKKPDVKIFHIPSSDQLSQLFDSWTKAAGVKKYVRYHTARHTFATLCLSSGIDLYTVSKLLGHRTIAATQIYAKVIDKKKRDAVAMLPPVD